MITKQYVQLLEHTPNPERLVAVAAKLCYSSSSIEELTFKQEDEMVGRFVNKLISMGHLSPVEHVTFTFGIEGISRITEIHLIRHRIASYSIQSGRYVNRENPIFITPPSIEASSVALKRYELIAQQSMEAYNDLFLILMLKQMNLSDHIIEHMTTDERISTVMMLQDSNKKEYNAFEKIAIEDARYAHLQSISTRVIMTMNVRELMHFFNTRCCTRAQWEVRDLASEMLIKCQEVAPLLFSKCGPSCVYGQCGEGQLCCGQQTNMRIKFNGIKI